MSEVYPHVSDQAVEARYWAWRWSLVTQVLITLAGGCLGGLAGWLIWILAGGPGGRPAVGATFLLGVVVASAVRVWFGPLLARFRGAFIAGALGHDLGCKRCHQIARDGSRSNTRQDP